jgi:hypothetical protein
LSHGVRVYGACSNGPPDGDPGWKPYSGDTLYSNNAKPTNWSQYTVDLTAELAPYKGGSVFIGLDTNNSWAASYNPQSWIDDVSLFAE